MYYFKQIKTTHDMKNKYILVISCNLLCRRVCLLLKYVLFVLHIDFTGFVLTKRATQQTPDFTSLLHTPGQRPEEQEQQ